MKPSLSQQVMRHLPPGQFAHHCQGHRDCRVEVTSRDSPTDQETEEYSNGPPTLNINQPRAKWNGKYLLLSIEKKNLRLKSFPRKQLNSWSGRQQFTSCPNSPKIYREEISFRIEREDCLGQGPISDDDEDESPCTQSTVDIITPEHSHLETLPGTLGLPGSQSSRPSPSSWGGHHRDSSADWEPRSNSSISTIFSPIGSATCIEYSERII